MRQLAEHGRRMTDLARASRACIGKVTVKWLFSSQGTAVPDTRLSRVARSLPESRGARKCRHGLSEARGERRL